MPWYKKLDRQKSIRIETQYNNKKKTSKILKKDLFSEFWKVFFSSIHVFQGRLNILK